MATIKDIFNIHNSQGLALNHCNVNSKSEYVLINRSGKNNGIAAHIDKISGKEPFPAGYITVALSGSVLETFYQPYPFFTSYHVASLEPKEKMSLQEIFYYITCIKKHQDKFNYGRQANRTLKDLTIPSRDEIPSWVYEMEIPTYDDIAESKTQEKVELPLVSKWKNFEYDKIFNMNRGQGGIIKNAKDNEGENEFITSSSENNGVSLYTGLTPTEKANTITVANNGSVGEAFFHTKPYLATSDVTVLDLKDRELNSSIAMFLITLIKKEQFKFNYGRKWGVTRMKKSIIKLPVTAEGKPDYDLMEKYINSLPYSKYI